jgi:staphylococcal nuclease domain-containing protein 1
MSTFEAKVKSVLSGDTVILHNINNPKQERTLSLAFVAAPRLKREGDEPFAFESRDYLRRLLVGKVVRFQVLYKIPTGANREYGLIVLPDRVLLPETAVAEGWLKLRDDAGRKEDSEEAAQLLERLQAVEAHARADSKGLWAETSSRIHVVSELSNAQQWVEEHRGRDLDAIVEKVLAGDRLIVRFLLSPTEHVQTMVLLAGIRAPATKRTNPSDGKEQPAEPFGDDAQQFVETRLLQRSATVSVLGTTPTGQIVADVRHPTQGSIAPFLLKAGLAKCTDHHTTLLGQQMGVLRLAEKAAKDARVGVFQGHVAPKSSAAGEAEAVVSRVQSADTLFLRNKAGVEKRINLSSVRQPKPTDPKQSPWVPEAKEFLRKKLIGKHVKYHVDGKRPATEGYDEREMATVTLQNKNVGLMLVENGMATVIRHRQDDTDRSPIYDDLLLAEQAAQAEQKGLWSPKGPSTKQYVDYSESLEKAKRQLPLLSRQRKVPAVVDFVKSASRFTVLVPRDNTKLTFVLSGIRAPRSARNDQDKGEPFGKEAHEFATRRCQQRDVEIDVEDCDKVGGFIGTLYINRENFAKTLVEEGLASVHAYSAEKAGNANELFAAEQRAKDARKGLWHDYDPSQDENYDEPAVTTTETASNGDAADASRRKDYRDIIVTHVEETGRLKFQEVGSGTSALTSLMNAFSKFHMNPANSAGVANPKAGEFVAAKFTADDTWYRARIRRNDREAKKAEVVYIDFGNSELIPWSRLRPLSQAEFLPSKLKPQAHEAQLSFVQLPQNPEYLADAVNFISQETADRSLVANVDQTDRDGTLWVTLFDPKSSQTAADSVNADVIDEGLGMVPKKLKGWERSASDVLATLKKKQDVAKEERRGQWEYGDLTEDD